MKFLLLFFPIFLAHGIHNDELTADRPVAEEKLFKKLNQDADCEFFTEEPKVKKGEEAHVHPLDYLHHLFLYEIARKDNEKFYERSDLAQWLVQKRLTEYVEKIKRIEKRFNDRLPSARIALEVAKKDYGINDIEKWRQETLPKLSAEIENMLYQSPFVQKKIAEIAETEPKLKETLAKLADPKVRKALLGDAAGRAMDQEPYQLVAYLRNISHMTGRLEDGEKYIGGSLRSWARKNIKYKEFNEVLSADERFRSLQYVFKDDCTDSAEEILKAIMAKETLPWLLEKFKKSKNPTIRVCIEEIVHPKHKGGGIRFFAFSEPNAKLGDKAVVFNKYSYEPSWEKRDFIPEKDTYEQKNNPAWVNWVKCKEPIFAYPTYRFDSKNPFWKKTKDYMLKNGLEACVKALS